MLWMLVLFAAAIAMIVTAKLFAIVSDNSALLSMFGLASGAGVIAGTDSDGFVSPLNDFVDLAGQARDWYHNHGHIRKKQTEVDTGTRKRCKRRVRDRKIKVPGASAGRGGKRPGKAGKPEKC